MISCAVHQPNLFPRASTLAKLFRAKIWVVLDNVQFNARDYQHRTWLAGLTDPREQQWLTLPVHRPNGRASWINELRLADRERSRRRVAQLIRQYYGRAPHWTETSQCVQAVLDELAFSDNLLSVAQVSTCALLDKLGWQGEVVRSSELGAFSGRSARLAQLTKAVGADTYLCGPGGAKYLDEAPFAELGITVSYPEPPAWTRRPENRFVTSLRALASFGPSGVRDMLSAPVTLPTG